MEGGGQLPILRGDFVGAALRVSHLLCIMEGALSYTWIWRQLKLFDGEGPKRSLDIVCQEMMDRIST